GQSGIGLSGTSGTGIGKSSKLPVAKSLDAPKTPPKPRDDTLGELIEQAVHEVEASVHQPQSPSQSSSPASAQQPFPHYRSDEPSMAMWVWALLIGGPLLVIILFIVLFTSGGH